MKKYYFKYRLSCGATGFGCITAKSKQDANEKALQRYGATIKFYDFTTKRRYEK